MKVVLAKSRPRRSKAVRSIPTKKGIMPDGRVVVVPVLDTENPNFGLQLEEVFRRNVKKALKNSKASARVRRAAAKS